MRKHQIDSWSGCGQKVRMHTTQATSPILLTPGPLTTAASTKEAMLRDFGSRDQAFIAITARTRQRLIAMCGGEGTHSCVLLQGSGTYAVEAALGAQVSTTVVGVRA